MMRKKYVVSALMMLFVVAQILTSVFIYRYLYDVETNNIMNNLKEQAEVTTNQFDIIASFITHTLNVDAGGCGLLGKYIKPDDFAKLVSVNTLFTSANIRYQRWYPLINHNERPAFEEFGKQYISPNFTIIDVISIFPVIDYHPAPNRSLYLPFTLSVPEFTTLPYGGDTYTVPSNAVLIPAVERNRLTATPRVRLVDSTLIDYAVLLFIPAYDNNNTIIGYVGSVVVFSNVLNNILANSKLKRANIDLLILDMSDDISDSNRLIYREDKTIYSSMDSYTKAKYDDIVQTDHTVVRDVMFIDRNYKFVFIYSEKYFNEQRNFFPPSILIMMVLISLFLDVFIVCGIILSLKSIYMNKQNEYLKMLTAVNHHLRNPLNGIMGYIEIIIYDMLEYIGIKTDDIDIILLKGFKTDKEVTVPASKLSGMINMLTDVYSLCKYLKYIVNDANFIADLINNNVYPIKNTLISSKKIFEKANFITNSIRDEYNNVQYEVKSNIKDDILFASDEKIILQVLIVLINTGFVCTNTKMSFEMNKVHTNLQFTVRNDGSINKIEKILNDADNTNLIGLNLYYTSKLADMIKGIIEFDNTLPNENKVTFTIPITTTPPIVIPNDIIEDVSVITQL